MEHTHISDTHISTMTVVQNQTQPEWLLLTFRISHQTQNMYEIYSSPHTMDEQDTHTKFVITNTPSSLGLCVISKGQLRQAIITP